MKHVLIILIALSMFSISYAQNTLSGIVYDKESKETLEGASVYFPDLNLGCQTDADGKFITHKLPLKTLKIEVSYLGYKPAFLTINPKEKTELKIELKPVAMQTDEVVVSGGTHSTQHDNPIKVEILKSENLKSSGAISFSENLASIPGVDVLSNGPAVSKPVIRGLSMTNILVLNDGVKLENFQFSENHPFIIDEFGADRIEIIKGPASLLYGSDAVGGVINLIPEKPAPIGKIKADINSRFHSNTLGNQTDIGVKGSSRNWSWGIRGGIRVHQDYLDGDNKQVKNTRFNEQSLKARIAYRNTFGNYNLSYQYNRPKLGMSVQKAASLIDDNNWLNDIWYQDLTNHLVSFKNKLYWEKLKFDINAAYQANTRKLQTDESMPRIEMVHMQLNTFSWDAKTYYPLKKHGEIILGLQGADKQNTNFDAPNRVIPDAEVFDISGLAYFSNQFANVINLQAGLRYDSRQIKAWDNVESHILDKHYANLSASAGATWKIRNDLLLRTNLASAFRTPNLAELTQDGVHGVTYEQGNSDLLSQRSYEADFSTHYHNDWLLVDIAGFYHLINHYIFLAPTSDSISGYQVYKYKQADASLYGSEFNLEILPTNWLNFSANYAYIKAKQFDGENLPLIPQNKIKTNIRYQPGRFWIFNSFAINFGSTWAFEKTDVANNETAAASYLIFNTGVKTRFTIYKQEVSIFAKINNLLNTAYMDHLSNLKPLGYYNIGRNIIFGINIPIG